MRLSVALSAVYVLSLSARRMNRGLPLLWSSESASMWVWALEWERVTPEAAVTALMLMMYISLALVLRKVASAPVRVAREAQV